MKTTTALMAAGVAVTISLTPLASIAGQKTGAGSLLPGTGSFSSDAGNTAEAVLKAELKRKLKAKAVDALQKTKKISVYVAKKLKGGPVGTIIVETLRPVQVGSN